MAIRARDHAGEADRPADDLEAPTVHVVFQAHPGRPPAIPTAVAAIRILIASSRLNLRPDWFRISESPWATVTTLDSTTRCAERMPVRPRRACWAPCSFSGPEVRGTPRGRIPAGDLVVNHPSCSLYCFGGFLVPGRASDRLPHGRVLRPCERLVSPLAAGCGVRSCRVAAARPTVSRGIPRAAGWAARGMSDNAIHVQFVTNKTRSCRSVTIVRPPGTIRVPTDHRRHYRTGDPMRWPPTS